MPSVRCNTDSTPTEPHSCTAIMSAITRTATYSEQGYLLRSQSAPSARCCRLLSAGQQVLRIPPNDKDGMLLLPLHNGTRQGKAETCIKVRTAVHPTKPCARAAKPLQGHLPLQGRLPLKGEPRCAREKQRALICCSTRPASLPCLQRDSHPHQITASQLAPLLEATSGTAASARDRSTALPQRRRGMHSAGRGASLGANSVTAGS